MRTSASGWVRTMSLLAQGEGVALTSLLPAVGLSTDMLDDPYLRISQETITHLWTRIVELTGNTAIGLKFGDYVTPSTLGAVGYVLLSCKTVKESLQQVARYQRYLAESLQCRLTEETNHYCLHFHALNEQPDVTPQTLDALLSTFMSYTRWVTRAPVIAERVFLQHPLPDCASTYNDFFKCPITDRAEFTGFWLSKPFVERALPTHDPLMLQQHIRMADNMVEHAFKPLGVQVKTLLREWLQGGDAVQPKVADAFHLTPKTLQRRLRQENTSFSKLLDECRFEAACAYLSQPNIALLEVADLAGYSDYSAFAKAFRRHSGHTPAAWRALKRPG